MEIALQPPHPTDLARIARQLRPSSFGPFWQFGEREMRRAIRTDRGPATLHLAWDAGGLWARTDGGLERDALQALVRRLLSFDHPLEAIERDLAADPRFAPLVARHRGLRIVQSLDLWEAVVTAVAGQQVSVAAASGMRRRLLAAGPRTVEGLALFPPPEAARTFSAALWAEMGFSRQKTAYLSALAADLADGVVGAGDFASREVAEAARRTGRLRGVGPWTVDIVRMRALGALDVWPEGDIGLREGLRRLLGLAQRPDARGARAFGQDLGDRASVLCFHLWAELAAGG